MLWFKPETNDKKVTWRFDGFMSSLSKDKKLTWFVEVYIIFDNDDMKTSFFFIIDFCFKMYFKIDSYKI